MDRYFDEIHDLRCLCPARYPPMPGRKEIRRPGRPQRVSVAGIKRIPE